MNNDISFFNKIIFWLREKFWQLWYRGILQIKCFFIGHDISYGDYRLYEDDMCRRCFIRNPTNEKVIPAYLHKGFVWVIEHTPIWFGEWLLDLDDCAKKFSWWEY